MASLLSPQALAHPCPAALSSPAPRDGPELGSASLRDQAACTTPGHLRPGCCRCPPPQAGERMGDPLCHCSSLWTKCLAEGGCWHTSLTRARATGNFIGQCQCLDTCSLGSLVAAGSPGRKAAELLLPALAEGAALASTGMGQYGAQLGSPAGLGADGTTAPQALPREPF